MQVCACVFYVYIRRVPLQQQAIAALVRLRCLHTDDMR